MRLIDADVKIHFNVYDEMHEENTLKEMTIIEFLDDFTDEGCPPTVDPVKHGHWIWDENGMDWGLGAWCCSECGIKPETWWESSERANPLMCAGGRFCGNCGAKMDEVDE